MALTKETTAATVKKYGAKETDTGNVKVQIAIMTQRVQQLNAQTSKVTAHSSKSSDFASSCLAELVSASVKSRQALCFAGFFLFKSSI